MTLPKDGEPKMKISDLAGLGASITRLIEVIAEGCGTVYKPTLIKKVANSDAYRILKLSAAVDEAQKSYGSSVTYKNGEVEIKSEAKREDLVLDNVGVAQRSMNRLHFQEENRQDNLDNITSLAVNYLFDQQEIPEERPDKDWTTRFFNHAQDVSSEEMQDIWARILAGEVKQPGSYSLRTLEFLKNMSKSEAEIFSRVAKFAYKITNDAWGVFAHDTGWLESHANILPADKFMLGELGILNNNDLSLNALEKSISTNIFTDDYLIILERDSDKPPLSIPVWKFTSVGSDLIGLISKPLDEAFIDNFGNYIKSRGYVAKLAAITIKHGKDYVSFNLLKEYRPEIT
jgi:Protein of unknown function (DUF2806)